MYRKEIKTYVKKLSIKQCLTISSSDIIYFSKYSNVVKGITCYDTMLGHI